MSVSITVDNVTKRFDKLTVIDGLSLKINPGEFFTLLGPSGCGKTTLLRMIIGFNSIEGGTIKIDDNVINNIPTHLRNMGMVFQNYAIFPHMSVADNVALGLKNRNFSKDEITKAVDEILEVVKITHLKDRMPTQLSGGQQQRVALARAIVIHPQVLLMDEPLSNLDAKLRVEMRNAIKHIQQKVGITTVYVTHDQEEALAVSDRIAVMHDGVIQQTGSPIEIYQRPANLFVSTCIGLSNILKGTIKKNGEVTEVSFGDYSVTMNNIKTTVSNNQKVSVSVRPEEFFIEENSTTGIPALVKNSVFLGVNTHYFLEFEDGQEVEVVRPSETGKVIPKETPVKLLLDTKKINVFVEDGSSSLIEESR